jgi:flagellar motor component MotA
MPENSNVELQYEEFQQITKNLRRIQGSLSELKRYFHSLPFREKEKYAGEIMQLKNRIVEDMLNRYDDESGKEEFEKDLRKRTLTNLVTLTIVDFNALITRLEPSAIRGIEKEIKKSVATIEEAADNAEDALQSLQDTKKGFAIAGAIVGVIGAVSISVSTGNFGGVITALGDVIAVAKDNG